MKHRTKPRSISDQVVTIGAESWEKIWAQSSRPRLLTESELAADGWKSVNAIAAAWGVGRAGCLERLKRSLAAGTIERIEAKLGPTSRRGHVYRPKLASVRAK